MKRYIDHLRIGRRGSDRRGFGYIGKKFASSLQLGSICLAAAMGLSALGMGCGHPHYYRVYDPYYTDYHVWNHDEVVYYNQWSAETHRDPHRDFRKLPPEEQKEYWTWRHNHGDRH